MRIALFDMFPEWPLARQTPDGALRWGATEFVINPSAGRFDGCVVFDGLLGETMIDCPGDRTIFIAGEPPSIKLYHTGFLAQFATVVTCHSDTPHPRKLHVQQGYPWHIGVARRDGGLVAALDYDAFRAAPPPEKEKLIPSPRLRRPAAAAFRRPPRHFRSRHQADRRQGGRHPALPLSCRAREQRVPRLLDREARR
jgi:hypothetical protein